MNPLKVDLTVIDSLRCAFVSRRDTSALTQSSSLACHRYSSTTQNFHAIVWALLQLTIQLEANSNDIQQTINSQCKQMPKSVGAQIPVKREVQWFLESKREHSEKWRLSHSKQPLSSRATERDGDGGIMLEFPSVSQSILLRLRLQSKETIKKVRQRKPPNSQTQ